MKRVIFSLLIFWCTSNNPIFCQSTIKMQKEGGVFTLPCKVNNLSLRFIFDTGASDVSISETQAKFMLKNGYLNKDDLQGVEYYQIADGNITAGTKVNLRVIEIGGIKVYDVQATIIHSASAPLLFGQSILERFGKFAFDYHTGILSLGSTGFAEKETSKDYTEKDNGRTNSGKDNYRSDTLEVKLQGKIFQFVPPEGYINYYNIDSGLVKQVVELISKRNKTIALYITANNLFGMLASDSVYFEKYLLISFNNQIRKPVDETSFAKIRDTICQMKFSGQENFLKDKIRELLNEFHVDSINTKAKFTDLNYCKSKDLCWVYNVAIANSDITGNGGIDKWIGVEFVGIIVVKNRIFWFTFVDRLGKSRTLDDCEKELNSILSSFNTDIKFDANDYLDLGIENYFNEKYSEALIDYNYAIRLDSTLIEAYNQRAVIRVAMKDYKGSIRDLNKYIANAPPDEVNYYNRGLAKNGNGDFTSAILDFSRAISMKSDFGKAYCERGRANNMLGKHKEAIIDYNKAIELNTKDDLSYLNRGTSKYFIGDLDGACKDWSVSAKLGNESAMTQKQNFCK